MGLFDRLLGREGVQLGPLFVPKKELRGCGISYLEVGGTRIAALNQVQYLREVAQIKRDEADWKALAPIPKCDEYDRPSLEWQTSLAYMICLLDEWVERRKQVIIEEHFAKEGVKSIADMEPYLRAKYIIAALMQSGNGAVGVSGHLADALADMADLHPYTIDSIVEAFLLTIKKGVAIKFGQYGPKTTPMSQELMWALTRRDDPGAKEALKELRSLKIDGEDVHDAFHGDLELCDIAIRHDVDAVVSRLEVLCDAYTLMWEAKKEAWGQHPNLPWASNPWEGSGFRLDLLDYSPKGDWEWAAYVLKQWGDERCVPVLTKIYPFLHFYERVRCKRLIETLPPSRGEVEVEVIWKLD